MPATDVDIINKNARQPFAKVPGIFNIRKDGVPHSLAE